jgi:hypothetical protein
MGTLLLIRIALPGGTMAAALTHKYHLKSVHEEIDLFDRKLAHLMNFEKFESEEDRAAAVRKLNVKRAALVKSALQLAADGVEYKQNDLPRSLRPKDLAPEAAPTPATPDAEVVVEASSLLRKQSSGPYTGTSLDWQASVREYLKKKNKS